MISVLSCHEHTLALCEALAQLGKERLGREGAIDPSYTPDAVKVTQGRGLMVAGTAVPQLRVTGAQTLRCQKLYAVPCCAVPCRAVPCRAVPCHASPCRAVACVVESFILAVFMNDTLH